MNNLILGATQYKSLKNRAVTGIETTWTLKENNKTARAAPPTDPESPVPNIDRPTNLLKITKKTHT